MPVEAMSCPKCHAPLAIPEHSDRTRCEYCDSLVRVRHDAAGPHAELEEPSGRVPIPEEITVEDFGGQTRISWRWFSWIYIPLLFFCIAWDAFLIFWYAMAVGGFGQFGAFSLIMIVFPIAHVAVGVGLTYLVLCGFLNSTVLTVDDRNLSVSHTPLPWRGAKTVPVDDIDRIYLEETTRTSKNHNTHVLHQVKYIDRQGRSSHLLRNLADEERARAVKQLLEDRLHLNA